jgi:hypothetical protein
MSHRSNPVRSWLLVVMGFAFALKAADRLPSWLAGTPHSVRVYATVADAERALGTRLWVPASPPDSLDWPPARVDAWPGPPTSVAIRVRGRSDGREQLVVVQSIGAPASPPDVLLEPMQELLTMRVPVGAHSAALTRGLAPGGRVLHDLSWDEGSRRLTIRYAGPVEELLLIAASLERTHS